MTRFAIPYTMRRRYQVLREDYSTVLLYSIGIPGKIKGKGGGGGGGGIALAKSFSGLA